MNNHVIRPLAAMLAGAAMLMLPACGAEESANSVRTTEAAKPGNESLAAALADAEDLSTVSGALRDGGLAKAFEGPAPYTILAPQDKAFDALGDAGTALREPAQRAAMLAILRDHIVPGYLTPKDIRAAIDRGGGRAVKMKTMAGQTVTFSGDGDTINIAHENGTTARLSGDPLLAGNGVALPIDGVLKKV